VPCTRIHVQIKGKGTDAHGTSSLMVLYDTSKLNLIHTNPFATPPNERRIDENRFICKSGGQTTYTRYFFVK
jgi:hypothetical protein